MWSLRSMWQLSRRWHKPSSGQHPVLRGRGDAGRARSSRAGGRRTANRRARSIDGARTLVLATDPHPRGSLCVTAKRGRCEGRPGPGPNGTGIGYDLSGIEATWGAEGDPAERPRWSGWWPLVDSEATWRLSQGSKSHEDCRALLSKPGRLVLSTLVRLPQGKVIFRIDGKGAVDEAALGDCAGRPGGRRASGRGLSRRSGGGVDGRSAVFHDQLAHRRPRPAGHDQGDLFGRRQQDGRTASPQPVTSAMGAAAGPKLRDCAGDRA